MSAAKIVEFKLGKGRTSRPTENEEWTKKSIDRSIEKYLELTVRMPEQFTEKDLTEAMLRSEYIIDNWLGAPEASLPSGPPQIPNFNPEDLMKHEGWKAKKTGEGEYAKGSLAWGWDFQDKFPAEIIKVLDKGPLEIDKYEFSLVGTIVQSKEKKEAKKRRA